MAGKPKARARLLAEALREHGLDPDNLTTPAPTPTGNVQSLGEPTHASARARESRAPTPIRPTGPQTRQAVDSRTADDLDKLARQLQPGLTVRLERTRPTWAAGWIEDMPLDDHDLAAVLEYVSQEHGGQTYRASVLSHEGAILYSSRITIAGPPRRRGRVTSRDAWDGAEEHRADSRPERHEPPALDLIGLFTVISKQQAEARAEQAEANRQRDTQIDRLVASLLTDRRQANAPPPPAPSLRDQLREVVQATQAVDEIREALSVDAAPRGRAPDRSPLAGVIEQAAGAMLAQGLQNDQQARAAQTAAQQRPQQRPPQQRPQQAPQQRPPQQRRPQEPPR
jgi:hypothetical protein